MKNFLQVNRALRAKKNFNFNFKHLFVLSAMLLLGSTQVWGAGTQVTFTANATSGQRGYVGGSDVDTLIRGQVTLKLDSLGSKTQTRQIYNSSADKEASWGLSSSATSDANKNYIELKASSGYNITGMQIRLAPNGTTESRCIAVCFASAFSMENNSVLDTISIPLLSNTNDNSASHTITLSGIPSGTGCIRIYKAVRYDGTHKKLVNTKGTVIWASSSAQTAYIPWIKVTYEAVSSGYTLTASPTVINPMTEDSKTGAITTTITNSPVTGITSGTTTSTTSNTFTVAKATPVTVTAPTTVAGTSAQCDECTYRFDSWENIPASVTADVSNIHAKYNTTYTISFKETDESAVDGISSTYYVYGTGKAVSSYPTPTKSGFNFNGWYQENTLTNAATNIGTTAYGNVTVYAKWTEVCADPTLPTNGAGTTTTQTVSWTAGGSETEWDVYYSTSSGTPAADQTPTYSPTSASYTFTGLTAGITYYWWVRAKCSATSKSDWVAGTSFTTRYCDAYSFHYGPNGGSWETPICFTQVGETHEWNIENFTIPSHANGEFWVGYAGATNGQSVTKRWTDGLSDTGSGIMNGAMVLLPTNGSIVGQASGATGTLSIWDDSESKNQYVGFKPDGYAIMYGGNNYAFSETATSNVWETDLLTLPDVSTTYQVGIKTASSYTTCSHSRAAEALSAPGNTMRKDGKKMLYLVPGVWRTGANNEHMAVWDATHSEWGNGGEFLTWNSSTNKYEGYVSGSAETIVFVRVDVNESSPTWTDGKWHNKTSDITLNLIDNQFSITGWGSSTSTYTQAPYSHPATGDNGKFRMYDNSNDANWYVHWIPYYKLSYDGNGGTGSVAAQYRNSELSTSPLIVAANGFTREGWTFTGWNTNKYGTGTDYAPGDNIDITGDQTLYAKWERDIYLQSDVSWWYNDNAWFAVYCFDSEHDTNYKWVSMSRAEVCSSPAVYKVALPGNNFDKVIFCRMKAADTETLSWDNKDNQTSDIAYPSLVQDKFTITNGDNGNACTGTWGTYSVPTFTISYNAGTGGSGSRDNDSKSCNVAFTLPGVVFSRTGYTQTGWALTENGSQSHALGGSYTTNADQTFYPVWTVNNYDLTWNLAGGTTTSTGTGIGSGVSSNTTTSQAFGTALTAPTVTKTGYNFNAWSPSVESTMPAAATTYTATWTAQQYSITYKDQGDVAFSGYHHRDKPGKHTYGSETTLKPAFKDGYVFGGWYTSSDCSTGLVTTIGATDKTADFKLYAKWTAMSLDALASGTTYYAQDMVPTGVTISGTSQYYPGVSSNNRFNIRGTGNTKSATCPMYAQNKSQTVDGIDFTQAVFFRYTADVSGTTIPTHNAIQFVISHDGYLDIYCNAPKTIYMIKSGGSAAQLDASATGGAKITKEVTAGTYYLYSTSGTYDSESDAPSSSERIFAMKFTPTYSVTYNANNGSATGSVPTDATAYESGQRPVVKGPGDLALEDHIFAGWNDKADGTGTYYSEKSNFAITADKTLYAVWRDISETTCPDGSSEATLFSLSMNNKSTDTEVFSFGDCKELSDDATITNGAASYTDIRTSDSPSGTKASIVKANPGQLKFGGNDAMLTLYLDCELAEGDVITVAGADLAITTTPTRATTIATSSNTLTIEASPAASNALKGKNVLYLWRSGGSTVSATGVTITRPATGYDVNIADMSNGSVSASPSKAAEDETVTLTVTPDTGYELSTLTVTGDESSSSITVANNEFTMPAEDVTVAATFTAKIYTISFDDQSATTAVSPSSVTATYNSSTLSSSITNPSKTGYTFGGWYKSTGGAGGLIISTGGALQASTDYTGAGGIWTNDGGVTVYAKWTANVYTVTLNKDGGTINSDNVTSYTYGVGATLPTDVTKSGYVFAGWYDNSGLTGDAVTTIADDVTGNKEYWAKWTELEDICETTDGYFLEAYDANQTINGVTYEMEYVNDGGYLQPNSAGAPYVKMSIGDLGYIREVKITLSAVGSGDSDKGLYYAFGKSYYDYEENLSLADGHIFGLSTGDISIRPTSGDPTEFTFSSYNTTLTISNICIYYEPAYFTVTYNANGGSSAPSDDTGTDITLNSGSGMTAPSGYTFAGWNTNATGTATGYAGGTTSINADLDLYAIWKPTTACADGYSHVYSYYDSRRLVNGKRYNAIETTTWGSISAGTSLPYTAISGLTSVVLTKGCQAENKIEAGYPWINSYIKVDKKSGTEGAGITITVASGYIGKLKIRAGGYSGNASIWNNGTKVVDATSGYATSQNAFTEQTIDLVTGANLIQFDGNNAYVSHIDVKMTQLYTLTLDKNNNDASGSTSGSAYVSPNGTTFQSGFTAPTRSRYAVTGYYAEAECTTLVADAEGNLEANVTVSAVDWTDKDGKWVKGSGATLYAKWGRVYTVTFNTNGGSSVDAITQTSEGASITMPAAPTKSGYTFNGWQIGSTYAAGASYTPTANVTAYATWKAECGVIKWDFTGYTEDEISLTEGASTEYTADDGATKMRYTAGSGDKIIAPDKGKLGYFRENGTTSSGSYKDTDGETAIGKTRLIRLFVEPGSGTLRINCNGTNGVYKVLDGSASGTTLISSLSANTTSSSITLTTSPLWIETTTKGYINDIRWTPSSTVCYYVTYNGNGADGGYVNDPEAHSSGDNVTTLANSFTRTGCTFTGWNTAADGSGTAYVAGGTIRSISGNVTLYAQWKITISENKNLSEYTSDALSTTDVVVTNGATLTVTEDTEVRNITVETGSTLNVNTTNGDGTGDGVTLTVHSLSLKGGLNSSCTEYDMPRVYINSKSSLEKSESTVNFDISVDQRNYYPIAVPFPVEVAEVDYVNSTMATYSEYGKHFVIKEYDGAGRAKNGAVDENWKVVSNTAGTKLLPGKGYILTAISKPAYGGGVIRFPMNVDDAWLTEGEQATVSAVTKNTVAVEAYEGTATEGGKNSNKGWNMLGVPYMSCFAPKVDEDYTITHSKSDAFIIGKLNFITGDYSADENIYVTVPTHDFSEYKQFSFADGDTKLLPGWCFFVQVDEGGTLTFDAAGQEESSSLPIYARREEMLMPTVKTGIILSSETASDKTTFLISDKYSVTDYEINADLEKMFGNGYTLATYSLAGTTRLAYNAMSRADATNVIPIGYRAPAEGEYTFAINPRYAENGDFERIDLIDYETGFVTNLLQSSYTFTSDRTQSDSRFALNVVPSKETPTGLENDANDANGVRKVIIDNKIYIIRGGQMYDATGRMVK